MKEELYRRYWEPKGYHADAVEAMLAMWEESYGISAGLLRPDDRLGDLFAPVPSNGIVQWWAFRGEELDWGHEFRVVLAERVRASRHTRGWRLAKFCTFDDLMKGWCGDGPSPEETIPDSES